MHALQQLAPMLGLSCVLSGTDSQATGITITHASPPVSLKANTRRQDPQNSRTQNHNWMAPVSNVGLLIQILHVMSQALMIVVTAVEFYFPFSFSFIFFHFVFFWPQAWESGNLSWLWHILGMVVGGRWGCFDWRGLMSYSNKGGRSAGEGVSSSTHLAEGARPTPPMGCWCLGGGGGYLLFEIG